MRGCNAFHGNIESNVFLHAAGTDNALHAVHKLGKRKTVFAQFYLARLDFGDVQNVVEQAQQMVRGNLYLIGAVQQFIGGTARVQFFSGDIGHADDGIHGCAYFMAHPGQEGALGLVGPVGRGTGLLQFRLDPAQFLFHGDPLRNVAGHAQQSQNLAPGIELGDAHHIHIFAVPVGEMHGFLGIQRRAPFDGRPEILLRAGGDLRREDGGRGQSANFLGRFIHQGRKARVDRLVVALLVLIPEDVR